MDFSTIGEYSSISLQGCASLLVLVIAWKVYKMKIHTLSRCFSKNRADDGIVLETINTGSQRDIQFAPLQRNDTANKNEAVI